MVLSLSLSLLPIHENNQRAPRSQRMARREAQHFKLGLFFVDYSLHPFWQKKNKSKTTTLFFMSQQSLPTSSQNHPPPLSPANKRRTTPPATSTAGVTRTITKKRIQKKPAAEKMDKSTYDTMIPNKAITTEATQLTDDKYKQTNTHTHTHTKRDSAHMRTRSPRTPRRTMRSKKTCLCFAPSLWCRLAL